jgi:hypothetical protein
MARATPLPADDQDRPPDAVEQLARRRSTLPEGATLEAVV